MNEINVNEVNNDEMVTLEESPVEEVKNETFEGEIAYESYMSYGLGLLVGVGISAASAVAYNKLVKPMAHKVKEKFLRRKAKSNTEEEIEVTEVETELVNETEEKVEQ